MGLLFLVIYGFLYYGVMITKERFFMQIFRSEHTRNYFKFIILFNTLFVLNLLPMDCNSKQDNGLAKEEVLTKEKKYSKMSAEELFGEMLINPKLRSFLIDCCSGECIPTNRFLGPLYIKKGLEETRKKRLMDNTVVYNCLEEPLDLENFDAKEETKSFVGQVLSNVVLAAGQGEADAKFFLGENTRELGREYSKRLNSRHLELLERACNKFF